MSSELDPIDVLADLLGEEGFEIADTRLAAVVIVQRLRDFGLQCRADRAAGSIGRRAAGRHARSPKAARRDRAP